MATAKPTFPTNLPPALVASRRRSLGLIAVSEDLQPVIREHASRAVLVPELDESDRLRRFLIEEASQRYSLTSDEAAFFADTVAQLVSVEVTRLRASVCAAGVA